MRSPQPYNLECGEISAPARKQMDDHLVRRGVRSRAGVASGAARICAYSFWRHPAESHSALCNLRSPFQPQEGIPESPAILGTSRARSGNVAVCATHVDLSGSLFTT